MKTKLGRKAYVRQLCRELAKEDVRCATAWADIEIYEQANHDLDGLYSEDRDEALRKAYAISNEAGRHKVAIEDLIREELDS